MKSLTERMDEYKEMLDYLELAELTDPEHSDMIRKIIRRLRVSWFRENHDLVVKYFYPFTLPVSKKCDDESFCKEETFLFDDRIQAISRWNNVYYVGEVTSDVESTYSGIVTIKSPDEYRQEGINPKGYKYPEYFMDEYFISKEGDYQ